MHYHFYTPSSGVAVQAGLLSSRAIKKAMLDFTDQSVNFAAILTFLQTPDQIVWHGSTVLKPQVSTLPWEQSPRQQSTLQNQSLSAEARSGNGKRTVPLIAFMASVISKLSHNQLCCMWLLHHLPIISNGLSSEFNDVF